MSKIQEVNNCYQCKWVDILHHKCIQTGETLFTLHKFPSWCPLPDSAVKEVK